MHLLLYRDLACYALCGGIGNTVLRHDHELKRIILEVDKRYLNTKNVFTRRRSATGGITIAFLGSDGAGKSSTVAEINRWLKKVMDVRLFYLGSGDGDSSLLRKPLKVLKKAAQKAGIIKVTNNYSDSNLEEKKDTDKKMNIARALWTYTLSKEKIHKLLQVSRCRMRGYIVLTDRYPQNEFEGMCDGPKMKGREGLAARKEAEAYRIAALCPPDVAIKLIVSPEVAMQRKPGEIQRDTSQSLTNRVKAIRFSDHTRIYEVDADQAQELVWLQVKRAIWESI